MDRDTTTRRHDDVIDAALAYADAWKGADRFDEVQAARQRLFRAVDRIEGTERLRFEPAEVKLTVTADAVDVIVSKPAWMSYARAWRAALDMLHRNTPKPGYPDGWTLFTAEGDAEVTRLRMEVFARLLDWHALYTERVSLHDDDAHRDARIRLSQALKELKAHTPAERTEAAQGQTWLADQASRIHVNDATDISEMVQQIAEQYKNLRPEDAVLNVEPAEPCQPDTESAPARPEGIADSRREPGSSCQPDTDSEDTGSADPLAEPLTIRALYDALRDAGTMASSRDHYDESVLLHGLAGRLFEQAVRARHGQLPCLNQPDTEPEPPNLPVTYRDLSEIFDRLAESQHGTRTAYRQIAAAVRVHEKRKNREMRVTDREDSSPAGLDTERNMG